jgi:hypothetical protein
MEPIFESANVRARFQRSAHDRLNPSCSINLRSEQAEVDLVLWESGEIELSAVETDGTITQKHFDDIQSPQNLYIVLSKLISLIDQARAK